jgi:ribose-phosphate pyrophosphokinase
LSRGDFIVFGGTASPSLTEAVAGALGVRVGEATVHRHPDGELAVDIQQPVRRKDVFIVQSTSPPVNDHLVELLALADACRRASAAHVAAIIPYFGYARSDNRHGRREPIAASMVADLLQAVGVNQVVTVDLHSPQIEGFFQVPVDSLTAVPVLCEALRSRVPEGTVVVSPDAGRVKMATQYAQRLRTSVVVLHKQRTSGADTRVTHVVGDVRDRTCLIVDDMVSTGGTIVEAIGALRRAGARPCMFVAATHGLLLEDAPKLLAHDALAELVITDTVERRGRAPAKLRVVSVAPLLAGTIQRVMADGSLSDLC